MSAATVAVTVSVPVRRFGVTTDYDYTLSHARERVQVWSGAFFSTLEAEGYSLPGNRGYMLTTHSGDKVRVAVEGRRTDDNYRIVDAAISRAMTEHEAIRDVMRATRDMPGAIVGVAA